MPALSPSVDRQAPVSWRLSEFHSVKRTAEILGLSTASVYALETGGKLEFRRVAGRVLVTTASLAAVVDGAEPWAASTRGRAGRAARHAGRAVGGQQ